MTLFDQFAVIIIIVVSWAIFGIQTDSIILQLKRIADALEKE